ncbi:hypothetical protein SCM27_15310, partial [Legionella pneumophila serogroup 1]
CTLRFFSRNDLATCTRIRAFRVGCLRRILPDHYSKKCSCTKSVHSAFLVAMIWQPDHPTMLLY